MAPSFSLLDINQIIAMKCRAMLILFETLENSNTIAHDDANQSDLNNKIRGNLY